MKVINRIATAPLRATSLRTGNLIAMALLVGFAGFAAGWVAATMHWQQFCTVLP